MKLHELRSLKAVIDAGFRVTAAADAVHTSQPGVSRHLKQIEESLGVTLFERRKHRLVGLTSAGKALVPMILRALEQLEGLERAAKRFVSGEFGTLTVATSHTHARYLLPPIIEAFIAAFPSVRLTLLQGHVGQIVGWLQSGDADISISSPPLASPLLLTFRPFLEVHRILLAPPQHPLLRIRRPTLRQLVQYPIITYGPEFAAYASIVKAFESQGLTPKIALGTGDTDTIKTYAMCGLGVAIVASSAFEPRMDDGLRAIDARHLFPSSVVAIGLNGERPLNPHAQTLISLLAPDPRM